MERTDLNLFRVFKAVMRHGNLTSAGRELGISASAVSHAVARMRSTLKDDLFVAGPCRMLPTAKALEMSSSISDALTLLDGVLAGRSFDPSTSQHTFRIAATDHVSALLLPRLIPDLLKRAQGIKLQVLPIGGENVTRQLDEGALDLVLGHAGLVAERLRHRPIFMEREALLVRQHHPLTRSRVDLMALLSFPHLFVDLTGHAGAEHGELRAGCDLYCQAWRNRLLAAGVAEKLAPSTNRSIANFALAATLVRSTDLIATVPERLAAMWPDQDQLACLPLPFLPMEIVISAVWHERGERDASLQWLIKETVEACATLAPLPAIPFQTEPDAHQRNAARPPAQILSDATT